VTQTTAPLDVYSDRLAFRQRLERSLSRRDKTLSLLRLVVFLIGAILFTEIVGHRRVELPWLLLPMLAFAGLVGLHSRVLRSLAQTRRAVEFYGKVIGRLNDDWMGKGFSGQEYLETKHPCADDLDLFGKGSLFELLCTAKTRVGQETLAAWLLEPADRETVLDRQKAVDELRDRLDLREDLAKLVGDPSEFADPKQLAVWTVKPPVFLRPFERLAMLMLSAVSILAVVMALQQRFHPLFLMLVLVVHYFCLRTLKKRTQPIAQGVSEVCRGLKSYSEVLRRLEREKCESPLLRDLLARLVREEVRASSQIRRLDQWVKLLEDGEKNMVFIPFAFLLFWPVHVSCLIERWRQTNGPYIVGWIRSVGEMEALCSLAGVAFERPDDTFPEIVETGPVFEAQAIGHPLIPDKKCVRNDVALGDKARLLIISGSNMSGKSTFLRTVGSSAVLAFAGGAVRAKKLRLSTMQIAASIQLRDSIQRGVSRFYVEITRIRDMLEGAKPYPPLLFLVDEIFQGTNSYDRRVAAEAIVRKLLEKGAFGLITTHDLALARIVDTLEGLGENVHFEDTVVGEELHFDYKLRPGVVAKGNALHLLRSIGLDL